MNILDILRSELRQASQLQELTIEYVITLPSEPEDSNLKKESSGDVLKQGSYWVNWSEHLGAWVSPDGQNIRVCITEKARNLDPGELTLGFTSTLTGICLNLQGQVAIHANAVIMNGKATAFIGYSGAGKSTLSAFCTSRGAGFITDDVLVVNHDGYVLPGNPRIKLYPATGASLGLNATQQTNYKIFYHPETHLGGTYQQEPVPLGSLYLLTATAGDRIYTEPVPPAQAVFDIITHGYSVSDFVDHNPRLLDVYVRLVNEFSVKRLCYPHDFNRLPDVYNFLLAESQQS
jgi:hypothetical protein